MGKVINYSKTEYTNTDSYTSTIDKPLFCALMYTYQSF